MNAERLSLFINRDQMLDKVKLLNQATKRLTEISLYEIYKKETLGLISANLNYVYDKSLIYTPDALIQSATTLLNKKGVRSLFDNEDLFHDCIIATLIAANRLNPHAPSVKSLWKSNDFTAALDKINAITNKYLGFDNFIYEPQINLIVSVLL